MTMARRLGKPALVKVATQGDPTELATGGGTMPTIWRGLLRADRLLCISRAIADEFRSLEVPDEQIVHVPNGVDTDAYRPGTEAERAQMRAGLGIDDDVTVLATVGRLAERKAIDVLLHAWSRLPETQRGRALLLVVGDGESGPALRTLATDLALEASVRFLGARTDVDMLLRGCDGFVFPSRREGLPNAVLEAMGSGLPVIATRIGGNVDLLGDDEFGLLCPPDDPDALAGAIRRLLDDPGCRRRLGEASEQRIASTYTFDTVIEQLLPLYGITPPQPPARERMRHAA
jgi:glycosyltransferase involved in cell wall biosynthesis